MDMVTGYMDMVVESTNLYNKCEMDYFTQAFAKPLTSLSGFLGMLTSVLEIILDAAEVPTYTGISKAAYDNDLANGGKYFGLWFKRAWGISLQDA